MHDSARLAAGALLLAWCLPASALLTRADRDDAEYLELATRYRAAVAVGEASGVLVAPRWILTAASVATGLASGGPVRVAGRTATVERVFPHPSWRPGGDPDVALVFLRGEVPGAEPVALYRGSEESGQAVRIVGFGETGRLGTAGRQRDGRARAGVNTVEAVAPATFAVRLKAPDEASDLQGALAAGDAGAPAFLETGGRILVGGIASRTQGAGDGRAGDVEVFARVGAVAAWVDEVIAKTAFEAAGEPQAKGGSAPR